MAVTEDEMMLHGQLSACQSCMREVRPVRGICPNCGHLMDARFAPPPQRLRSAPSWWHDDLALILAVTTALGALGTACYFAVNALL